MERAQAMQTHNAREALTHYHTAMKMLEEEDKPVPRELKNNIGVLYYQLRDYAKAYQSLQEAIIGDFSDAMDLGSDPFIESRGSDLSDSPC